MKRICAFLMCCVWLMASLLGLAASVRADDPPPPWVSVSGGSSEPITLGPNQVQQLTFTATVHDPPQGTSECQITGPDWDWSVSASPSGSLHRDVNGDTVTVSVSFSQPGQYIVSASATATYHSECSGDVTAGTNDDAEVTLVVPPKHYEPDTPIGDDLQDDGTVRPSGRITSPQDQTKSPATPSTVRVRLGARFTAAVETAIDIDKWTQAGVTGHDKDTIPNDHYVWTCGSAIFLTGQVDAQGNPILAVSKTGISVPAIAPSTPGTLTLACTINDLPTALRSGEDGSRDDADALTRTVEVQVYDPTSWVEEHFYRNAKDANGNNVPGAEVSGKAGGLLWRETRLQVGGYSRIKSGQSALSFDLEENYSGHTNGSNHMRLTDGLTGQWEKKKSDGTWDDREVPSTENDSPTPRLYRHFETWDTTKYPLGHNATHTLKLLGARGSGTNEDPWNGCLEFEESDGNGGWNADQFTVPTLSVDVANLYVPIGSVQGNMNNPDYIVFAPDSGVPALVTPQISFEIKDEGDPHAYLYYVHLKEVNTQDWSATGYHLIRGEQTGPGVVNVPWTDTRSDGFKIPPGVYTFDIHVLEYNGPDGPNSPQLDEWWLKMLYNLKIPGNSSLIPGGHTFSLDFDEDSESTHARATYTLEDPYSVPGKELSIDVFDPDLTVKRTYSGSAALNQKFPANAPDEKLDLYTLNDDDPGGWWRGIWRGQDGHGVDQRDHTDKRMLAVNAGAASKDFYVQEEITKDPSTPNAEGGENEGVLNPYVFSGVPQAAFKSTGWRMHNANQLKPDPDPTFVATKFPFYKYWSDVFDAGKESEVNKKYFRNYHNRQSAHAIHFMVSAYDNPERSYGSLANSTEVERSTIEYVNKIKVESGAWNVRSSDSPTDPAAVAKVAEVTTHELGHHLSTNAVENGHHMRYVITTVWNEALGRDITVKVPTLVIPAEAWAVANQDMVELAKWRLPWNTMGHKARELDPNEPFSEAAFRCCVMAGPDTPTPAVPFFCESHRKEIEGYNFETLTSATAYTGQAPTPPAP